MTICRTDSPPDRLFVIDEHHHRSGDRRLWELGRDRGCLRARVLALGHGPRAEPGREAVAAGEAQARPGREARLRDRAFLRLAQASLPNSAEAVFEETRSGIKTGRELLDEREAELTEAFAAASRSATELARILRKRRPDDG